MNRGKRHLWFVCRKKFDHSAGNISDFSKCIKISENERARHVEAGKGFGNDYGKVVDE